MLWRLVITHGDGTTEDLTAPLPASFFLENWPLVVDTLGRYGPHPAFRLISEDGFGLAPLGGDDCVAWWRVEPLGFVKPDLRSALTLAEHKRRMIS
ncbi:hypothetical protein [Paludisphaera mucosa]|uniref:Uncharacterized protein n=1 Tax=Paludisphaera mucosa TaxID=3030827 RepID=A0ABT6F3S4_9BACT|nr:hypothetical protein [Paludisphaera mucosa]MDG3002210.1 hypothetical protein [Paludisphaera mucosa]